MDLTWPNIAVHIVESLGVQTDELVQVRDNAGHLDALLEIALAIELRGATPLVQLVPGDYMKRMLNRAPPDYLNRWDRHRGRWVEHTDRVLVLTDSEPGFGHVPAERMKAWQGAVHRLTRLEEERELPYLLAAIPTEARARQLGLDLEALEALLLPALLADAQELRAEIDRALALVEGGRTIVVHSGGGHVLRLQRGERAWRSDGGAHDGGNLPSGALYTTVLEGETEGSLWLPRAAGATDVVLHFVEGRIGRIEAASGADALEAMLDAHRGEPRRVSHVGVGLNPHLRQPIGWTLVDEHVRGAFFIALGENRYMGGQNESSLNIDFCNPGATVEVDGRVLVSDEGLAV